ncbi:MAG: hypothetical protein KatS3mg035_1784 [Bacteroidia bacterium]|nr:MAG: hypothetical protein KatS3mg035_1784 [Bacteroidia bacterium]
MNIFELKTAWDEFDSKKPENFNNILSVALLGPRAKLFRFNNLNEKPLINLGNYNPTLTQNYGWPALPTGSVVDLTFVKIFIENALLNYYKDLIGGGDGIVTAVSGYSNQIKTSASRGFKENGAAYPRLAGLKDYDVQPGDTVIIRGGTPIQEFRSEVLNLIPDVVPATVDSAFSDTSNKNSQPNSQVTATISVNPTGGGSSGGFLAAGTYYIQFAFTGPFGTTWGSTSHIGASAVSFSISAGNIPRVNLPTLPAGATGINIYLTQPGGSPGTETLYASGVTGATYDLVAAHTTGTAPVPLSAVQVSGAVNNVKAAATSLTYKGDVTGDISETYTIVVVQGSTGGDATTAKLQVISASGRDDVSNVTPAAFGSNTPIGTRGLAVRWTTSGSHDFIAGQTWQVNAKQTFIQPSATSGGTYSGDEINSQFTYIVKVSRGGYYSDPQKPQIIVSRSDGADIKGPVDVVAHSTFVQVGNYGITVSFSNNGSNPGLCKGDTYYIPVVSKKYGAYKTILLKNNLPPDLVSAGDLELSLCRKETIQLSPRKFSNPLNFNWSATQSQITIYNNVEAKSNFLTDGGTSYPVPVIEGNIYVQYKVWLNQYSGILRTYFPDSTDPEKLKNDIENIFGAGSVDPENPIPYALWKTACNNNKQIIFYSIVADPTKTSDWQNSLLLFEGVPEIYSVIPLTQDENIFNLVKNHVITRSDDNVGGEWRVAWFNQKIDDYIPIVNQTTTHDGLPVLATLNDNPNESGLQYTYLTATSGNAKFLTKGVQPNDIVRYLFSVSPSGEEIYSQFIVKEVVNEDTIILFVGNSTPVTVPQKVEVWRSVTPSFITTSLITKAAEFNNSRIYLTWPDQVTAFDDQTEVSVPGYYLNAAIAGAVSGILPHQGIRNASIVGFSKASRSSELLSNYHLNLLLNNGVFVVTDNNNKIVYNYSARNTEIGANKEELAVRNTDAIKKYIYKNLQQFIGVANNIETVYPLIRHQLITVLESLRSTRIPRIGSPITSFNIESIAAHPTEEDKLVIQLNLIRPVPINSVKITLII